MSVAELDKSSFTSVMSKIRPHVEQYTFQRSWHPMLTKLEPRCFLETTFLSEGQKDGLLFYFCEGHNCYLRMFKASWCYAALGMAVFDTGGWGWEAVNVLDDFETGSTALD